MNNSAISQLVRERLEHVNLIYELRHQFNNPALATPIGEHGVTHPWRYFDALMNYLLLTCFDLLGQPNEWVSFAQWLESNEKSEERNKAVSQLLPNLSPIEIAMHMSKCYNSIYGVRSSFNNFILNVLDEDERGSLYDSVRIEKIGISSDPRTSAPYVGEITEEKKKRDFLFGLRNKFTHSALTMGSPNAGFFSDAYEPVEFGGKLLVKQIEIHRESSTNGYISYQVRSWPQILIQHISSANARREASEQAKPEVK